MSVPKAGSLTYVSISSILLKSLNVSFVTNNLNICWFAIESKII